MHRDPFLAKYDQDTPSAAGSNLSHSTLSNNSQNRLYEKLGFSRQHLQTIVVLGNSTFLSELVYNYTPLRVCIIIVLILIIADGLIS